MLKVIITGPESSGKTTLCKALSKHFNLPSHNEYARQYLDELERDYKQNDLMEIAKIQLQSEQNMQILDTDLITIKIWSEYKYGSCDKWILNQIEKQKAENRYYFLCQPDIPWQADTQRENPHEREELFEIFKKELDGLKHEYFIVEGENRLEKIIQNLCNRNILTKKNKI